MDKLFFISKFFLLLIFFAGLFLLATQADGIRKEIAGRFGLSEKSVAGAKTSFEKEVKEDMQNYAEDAKKSLLQIKVEDVIHSVSRVKKIGEDINGLKEYVVDLIQGVGK